MRLRVYLSGYRNHEGSPMDNMNKGATGLSEIALSTSEQSAHAEMSYKTLSIFITTKRLLMLIVLTLIVCFYAKIASAQEELSGQSASNSIQAATGWWSPGQAKTTTGPQLEINMAQLNRFALSDSLRDSAETSSHWSIATPEIPAFSLYYIASETRIDQSQLLIDRSSVSSSSLIGLLETSYADWEAGLSDSRPLTNVHGLLVYPIMEVTYTSWHLPVSLYIPALRGSVQ
jgi:hypothetical protein